MRRCQVCGNHYRYCTCEGILLDNDTAVVVEPVFRDLPEYSTTIPTGTRVGKRWKRAVYLGPNREGRSPYEVVGWMLGEYVAHPDPGLVGIHWRDLEVA